MEMPPFEGVVIQQFAVPPTTKVGMTGHCLAMSVEKIIIVRIAYDRNKTIFSLSRSEMVRFGKGGQIGVM